MFKFKFYKLFVNMYRQFNYFLNANFKMLKFKSPALNISLIQIYFIYHFQSKSVQKYMNRLNNLIANLCVD